MKISLICFSLTGNALGERLCRDLEAEGHKVTLAGKSKYLPDPIKESTKEWAGNAFAESDAVIFIGACGIAVRSIAPHITGKKTDPAVLVIDECGKFVISLLSGHLGGANELAQRVSEILGAVCVVTTATDLHHRFAVDMFAKKNGCAILGMKSAKEISAALLAGETVGFYSDFPCEGELPQGLVSCGCQGKTQNGQQMDLGVCVTIHKNVRPFASTVHVIPPAAVLGIGCRKGREYEGILAAAERLLEKEGLFREAVCGAASVDLKKEEPGIQRLVREWDIPFFTYSAEQLMEAKGDFTPSAFVRSVTGADNVCERSAVLASDGGRLLVKKQAADGVTAAAALREWRINFE